MGRSVTYRTGHIADHPAVVARRTGLHLHPKFGAIMARASSLPMATTNRAKLSTSQGGPGILNQGQTGSCEGHAHASGATLLLANQGKSQGLISPVALYLGALLIDRTVSDGALSTVTDAGTMPSSIISAWQTFGARLAASDPQYPANPATLYEQPSNTNSPLILPSLETLYADSPYRFGGAYFLTGASTSPAYLLSALATLASGYTLTDAIPASGSEFQNYTGGVIGALSGPIDHANLLVDTQWTGSAPDWATFCSALTSGDASTVTRLAMATSAAGIPNLIFWGVNSWSTAWGTGDPVSTMSGGLYMANLDYFTQAQDLLVLDLSAAA
jgi:hypothetical protein